MLIAHLNSSELILAARAPGQAESTRAIRTIPRRARVFCRKRRAWVLREPWEYRDIPVVAKALEDFRRQQTIEEVG